MNILHDFAIKLGITRAEMTAITLLTFFLLTGGVVKYSDATQDGDKVVEQAEAARFPEADVDSLLALALQEKENVGNPGAPAETKTTCILAANVKSKKPVAKASEQPASRKKLTGTISFGNASASELQQISGIGPVMAKRLIEFRQRKGGKVEHFNDFLEVKGIGKKKLERLKKHLTLD